MLNLRADLRRGDENYKSFHIFIGDSGFVHENHATDVPAT